MWLRFKGGAENSMISVQLFRERIRDGQAEALLEEVLLAEEALHVEVANIEHLRSALGAKFTTPASEVKVWIVGSAKLGFAITEKRTRGGTVLPRYRPFSPVSDIDVAVVSTAIFDLIWGELSTHAHQTPRLPWDSGPLGDYLVCGWLRPDHFPIRERLRRCDDWWDLFRSLSVDARFGRRKLRGGLFYSVEHMKQYSRRALKECVIAAALNP